MGKIKLPEEIGDYKLRICEIKEFVIVEYSKQPCFMHLLTGQNFDEKDLKYQVFAENRDEAILLMELKLNLIEFCKKDLKKNDILAFINPYIKIHHVDLGIIKRKIFCVYEIWKLEHNYKSIAIISTSITEELAYMIDFINNVWLKKKEEIHIEDEECNSRNLLFNNIVYLYTGYLSAEEKENVRKTFKKHKMTVKIRDNEYREKQKAKFFICHDSRDKDLVAKPLYEELIRKGIKVWYDEYSLEIGDSLLDSIQKGINDCKYAIVVISKNFLSNENWTQFELKSILNKQILSGNKKTILPIWHGISTDDLIKTNNYHLLDTVAGKTDEGIETLARKLDCID